ncbi:hypothetical protein [Streptomyces radicis]|uniref:Prevent-host-death family protein n=1 Tax=Streptomyces radicis TaxID=1750517 RepID=A0A3A9W9C3_9ACTN|nr:hypothetical protein [Streptomyces radicis]RKN08943.1 hypothetical protein D7319_13450 [Streptomyces radicis]RKN22865.1 hypothetical protein D7318_15105 [Streptomyces radicis]
MTVTQAEANFSELIQRPKDTVARMQSSTRKGIRLHRRDEEDLYLTTASKADEAVRVVESTTRMFTALIKSDPTAAQSLADVFPEAFPWVRFLPREAAREFLAEFMETARAASDLGSISPLVPLIASWKSTAEVYADPELAAQLRQSTDDDLGPVERPE